MSVAVNIAQDSQEWLAWRKTGVTASEIGAIMGLSPYATRSDVLARKLGNANQQYQTAQMQRGKDLEPVARAEYEKITGNVVQPACYETNIDGVPFLASLDGIDFDETLIVEIKCPSIEEHKIVISGIVPATYMAQVQHQMIACGVTFCDFVSYQPDHDQPIAIVKVQGNDSWRAEIIDAAKALWNEAQEKKALVPSSFDIPPTLSVTQYVDALAARAGIAQITSHETFEAYAAMAKEVVRYKKELETEQSFLMAPIKEAKARIDELVSGPKAILLDVETRLRDAMNAYQTARAEARAKEESEAKAKADAEHKAAIKAAHDAAELAKANAETNPTPQAQNAVALTAQAVQIAEITRPAVMLSPAPSRVAGIGSRDVWTCEIVELRVLLEAALRSPDLMQYLEPNMKLLNALARVQKQAFSVPGLRAVCSKSVSIRT